MRVVWVVVIAVLGCGRIDFAPLGDAGDGSRNDARGTNEVATHCGSTLMTFDDFTASTLSPEYITYVGAGGLLSQGGGELSATFPATTPASSLYIGLESSRYMDWRDGRMFVNVKQVLSTATNGVTRVQMVQDTMHYVQIIERAGTLYAIVALGGAGNQIGAVPYDPITHAWWQLRESQGTVYFETSMDGQTFVPFANTSSPPFSSLVRIDLSAGTDAVETNAGAAKFAALNGGRPPIGTWCPASDLKDDFSSNVFGSQWANKYCPTPAQCSMGSGAVTLTLPAAMNLQDGLESATAYDLTEDSIFTLASTVPNQTGAYSFLRARTHANDFLVIQEAQGVISCSRGIGGSITSLSTRAYSAASDKFWRIRGAGGSVFFETSSDGMSWNSLYSEPTMLPLDSLFVGVGAGAGTSTPAMEADVFDTFNKLPP